VTDALRFPLLVTGAAGHLGRRVIAHLLETHKVPANQIIAATRVPESLADLSARGVVVRQCDFDDAASLARGFSGAARVLLISTDKIDPPGSRIRQHAAAIRAAAAAGVAHLVYTSMPKPEPGSPIPFAPDHYATEQALASSASSVTVLRNCWYMENLLGSLPQALTSGKWFTAAGDGRIAYVSREDCARTAAAALASSATPSATYTITGPEALTTAEIAQLASETVGKPIEVIQVPPLGLKQGLLDAGLPPAIAELLTSFDVNTAAGNVSEVTGAVQQLTGKAPQSLREFLVANSAALGG
jgi:NAD(P)H dehydrogenase (quinone)